MKKIHIALILLLSYLQGMAQDKSSTLAPLLNFNFAGQKNNWTNLTPAVNYGFTQSFLVSGEWFYELHIGPYLGTTISIKDSSAYLPALMLPGNAGLEFTNFISWRNSSNSFSFAPSLGLKVISGFTDSALSIVQHNLKLVATFKHEELFRISAAYTWAWHNSSDYSETKFNQIFKQPPHQMEYFTIALTTKVVDLKDSENPLYFNITWRNLFTRDLKQYPNYRFFTVGFTANLKLQTSAATNVVNKTAFL